MPSITSPFVEAPPRYPIDSLTLFDPKVSPAAAKALEAARGGRRMIPYFSDSWLTVYLGDCRDVLATLPPGSVNCVVTSPPYWGLRDYGVAGQLGLERTPQEYVAAMVGVFREVRRVLRDDGTLWLNLGDTYAGGGRGGNPDDSPFRKQATNHGSVTDATKEPWPIPVGLKPKDLVGIPWRVAFALQEDGWYLRSDIIWAKTNPMPESVTDRPTKSHEYLFLLTRSSRYHYDAAAIREQATYDRPGADKRFPLGWATGPGAHSTLEHNGRGRRERTFARNGAVSELVIPGQQAAQHRSGRTDEVPDSRNRRSVWSIATTSYPGAHFATFPEALVEPCVLAGCPVLGTVLDPFAGTGTVGLVANRLGRRAVLIDLSADYLDQAMVRNAQQPMGLAVG